MNSLLSQPDASPDWLQLSPLLDDAMHELNESDREAVLLRHFQNFSYAEIGGRTGLTENAARMRVERALEKLRGILGKKGIATTAALAAVISANAVQAAPIGLAATISAAALAGTAVTTSTIIAATKTIAMTTLQKTVITAAFVAATGAGIFEAKQATDARKEVIRLQAQRTPLADQIQQAAAQLAKATNVIAGLNEELAKNERNKRELMKLRGEVGVLKMQASDAEKLRAENFKLSENLKLHQKFNTQSLPKPQIEAAAFADQMNSLAIQIEQASNELSSIRVALNIDDTTDETNFPVAVTAEQGNQLVRYFDIKRKMHTLLDAEKFFRDVQATNGQ